MRAFFSAFILATLALTANASIIYQRASTTDIQTCLSDLTAAESSSTTTENNFKALTVQNISASFGAIFKDVDSLAKAMQKATESCCNPAANKLNEKISNYLFDEADKAQYTTSDRLKSISGQYSDSLTRAFPKVLQKAETLDRCLAERSAKDKTFETIGKSYYKFILKIRLSFNLGNTYRPPKIRYR